MESDILADAQMLNEIKNRVREITRVLDVSCKVYPDTLESSQVKHEVSELLCALHLHGLLPVQVSMGANATRVCR